MTDQVGNPEDRFSHNEAHIHYYRERLKKMRGKAPKKSRDWILDKKERRRRQGK